MTQVLCQTLNLKPRLTICLYLNAITSEIRKQHETGDPLRNRLIMFIMIVYKNRIIGIKKKIFCPIHVTHI